MGYTLHLNRPTLLGLAAILLWSSTVALARSITEQIGPLTAGAAVYLTSGLLLAGLFFARERSFKKLQALPLLYVWGCGVLFVLYTIALFFALGLAANRPQTLEIGLLNYLWPALTLLFSLVILDKRAGWGLVPGTLLALGGVFLVLTQGAVVSWSSFATNFLSNPLAYSLGVVAAVAWGLYSNLARRWGGPDSSGAVLLFTLGTGLAFLLIRLFDVETGVWSFGVVTEIALLALATSLGYLFWDIAMRAGDVVLVASCSYLTPFFSTVVSSFYLRVLPGINLWLGCVLIMVGSFLSWRSINGGKPR
jgi:drug/metabolite transporter (DMT)-like permease